MTVASLLEQCTRRTGTVTAACAGLCIAGVGASTVICWLAGEAWVRRGGFTMRLRRGTRTLTAVAHASSWLKARRRCQVCIAAASLVAVLGGAVVAVPVTAQDITTGDDAEVRIVARRLESGRVEFGLQQRQADNSWGNRQLPRVRFFPTTATVGRWLASSAIGLPVGEVRIVARRLESGRVEFGLQQRQADNSWGNRQLPRVRFFPTTARVGRWLASSPLTVTAFPIAGADSGAIADGRPQQGDGSYRDVRADAPYAEAVAALAEAGVFAGTWCDDGFCPDDPIDRKTMAVWLVRLLDGEDPARVAETRFSDVDADGFEPPFIEHLADLNVVTGCRPASFRRVDRVDGFSGESTFGPDRIVTRAQAVAFLGGFYCLHWGVPDPGFSDVSRSAWYANDVAAAVAWGITDGCADGSRFCPDRATTRAEMSTFLWRAENPPFPQEPPVEQTRQVPSELNATMDGGGVISLGDDTACALRYDRTVTCWGLHFDGRMNFPPFRFSGVSTGSGWHTCGVRIDQTVICWGNRAYAPSGRFTAVSTGAVHSCGLKIDSTIECWWSTEHYQYRDQTNRGQADAPAGRFTAVSAGFNHSCGIRTDQTIICWGENRLGQSDAPAGEFRAVSAGAIHSCGIDTDQTVTCWGDNRQGQVDAPAGRFTSVSAGPLFTCGIRTGQTITCWGDNETLRNIRSGRYTGVISHVVRDVPAGRFTAIAASDNNYACAVRTDGIVECWGAAAARDVGWLRPSTAVWARDPVAADCPPQTRSEGKPDRPAGVQVTLTGAVDAGGRLTPPATVRWTSPCSGSRVDHYLVQWRRGHEDFTDDSQQIVEEINTTDVYSLKLRDPWVYAVRVVAVNGNGLSPSAELIVPTPANEVRTTAESIVTTLQDNNPWFSDVWDYMNRRPTRIQARYCHIRFSYISCVNGTGAMWIAYPASSFNTTDTIVHEMAHLYHHFTFAQSNTQNFFNDEDADHVAENAAAIAAALLYLYTNFPGCRGSEMLADMPSMVIGRLDGILFDLYRWFECEQKTRSSRDSSRDFWSSEAVVGAKDIARSVFADQEVPQWFYDTYQRADGTWDIEAIRDAIKALDGVAPRNDIEVSLRNLIPEL